MTVRSATAGLFTVNGRRIAPGEPTYVIAEMSANHNQDLRVALEVVRAAKAAGADAIKLQTYTADTLTLDCAGEPFQIRGTLWEGRRLYELYRHAYTPWEWHGELKAAARDLGLDFLSTPFDPTAVDFLDDLDVAAFKIASFEIVDVPLIEYAARKGRPLIMSTGMATLAEIDEAVRVARAGGAPAIALLRCVSAYPAEPDEMNLRTIPHMAERFRVPVGLSDHTLGIEVPVAAVALGACLVEKHLTLSRSIPSPDAAFSLEPDEFRKMVEAVRVVERSLGDVCYVPSAREAASARFRRSLFAVEDIQAGEPFTTRNVRSIRPGDGLAPRFLSQVLGRKAAYDIARGTPLAWEHLAGAGGTSDAANRPARLARSRR